MSEHRGERFALYRYWGEAIAMGGGKNSDEEVLEYAKRIVEIAETHIAKHEEEHTRMLCEYEAQRAILAEAQKKKK